MRYIGPILPKELKCKTEAQMSWKDPDVPVGPSFADLLLTEGVVNCYLRLSLCPA